MIKQPPSQDDTKYVTKAIFEQFSTMVNNQFNKVLTKMSTIESLLQSLVENQRQQQVQEFEIVHEPAADQYENERGEIEALDDELELQIEDSGTEDTIYIQQPHSSHTKIQTNRTGLTKRKFETYPTEVAPLKKIKREPANTEQGLTDIEYSGMETNEQDQLETVETIEAIDEHTGEVLRKMFVRQDNLVSGDVKNSFYDIPLPAPTISCLKALSSQLEQDPIALLKFKQVMNDINTRNEGNFQKALSMMIADPVLFELNWLGFKGKQKMADMFLFQNLLYEEWFPGMDYDDYITQVKLVIKKAHKRYAKNQERRRARESLIVPKKEDPLNEAVKAITIEYKE